MTIEVRKGQGPFANVSTELDRVVEIAWKAYDEYHKSSRKRKARPSFATSHEALDRDTAVQDEVRNAASHRGRKACPCRPASQTRWQRSFSPAQIDRGRI